MARNKDWQGKTGGGNFGQKFLFFYFKYGSITLIYGVVSVVILFYLAVNYKNTRNIYRYFRKRQLFPIWKSALSVYRNHYLFGKTVIDKFAIFAGRKKDYVVEIDGQDIFDKTVENADTGAVILNSHVGNVEMAGYFFRMKKKILYAVVYAGEAAEMQKHRTNVLGENNICMIPVVDGFSHIFVVHNALREFNLVSMAGDRVYGGSKNISLPFLGEPAEFPTAAFQLAVKLKTPMLTVFVMQNGHKKYKGYVYPLEVADIQFYSEQEQVEMLMKRYVSVLEGILQKYPLQWYNFYDFWKNEKINREDKNN